MLLTSDFRQAIPAKNVGARQVDVAFPDDGLAFLGLSDNDDMLHATVGARDIDSSCKIFDGKAVWLVGLIGLPGLSAICRTTEGAVFHSVDTSRTNGQKDVGS